jgi:hypothetical protein
MILSPLYLKGMVFFIDCPGSINYGLVTLQLRLSYMVSGALDWKRRFIVVG